MIDEDIKGRPEHPHNKINRKNEGLISQLIGKNISSLWLQTGEDNLKAIFIIWKRIA
jgi:hypothetical protein